MILLINFVTVTTLVFAEISKNVVAYPSEKLAKSDLTLRIVGGKEAKDGKFPYVAGLKLIDTEGFTSDCGGSLISPTSILTAAHCLHGIRLARVSLGARNITENSTERKKQMFNSTNFIIHPNFDFTKENNDIAIIKLPYPATLNKHVNLILIPSDDKKTYAGKSGAPRLNYSIIIYNYRAITKIETARVGFVLGPLRTSAKTSKR